MPSLRVDWATHQSVVYACTHWHYSRSVPVPPLVKIGVWEDALFIGAVVFARGASQNLLRPFGLAQTEGCELTRVALTKHATPVTRIVRLAVAFLKRNSPGLRLVVSFADPAQGHHGGIYQAGNWIYSGDTPPSSKYIGPDGKEWHSRMINKQGFTTVQGAIRRVFTPSQCKKIEYPGKHRYLLALDASMREAIAPLAKPYPRRLQHAA